MHIAKRKIEMVIALCLVLLIGVQSPAISQEFVRVSGQVKAPAGFVLENSRVVVNNGQFTAEANSSGRYEIIIPKGIEVEFVFVTTIYAGNFSRDQAQPTFANWRTSVTFQDSTTLNFDVPLPQRVKVTFVDAQNNPLPLAKLLNRNFNDQYDPFKQSGLTWKGLHRVTDRLINPYLTSDAWTDTGEMEILLFADSDHQGFQHYGFVSRGRGQETGPVYTSTFKVTPGLELKLCHPVNFGSSLTLPSGCFMTAEEQRSKPTPTPSTPIREGLAYKVKAGDTWLKIATAFGVTMNNLLRHNELPTSTALKVGMVLYIPQSPNCAALNKAYPGGVAKSVKWVNKGSKLKRKPAVNPDVYNLNKSLDTDNDGLVCER